MTRPVARFIDTVQVGDTVLVGPAVPAPGKDGLLDMVMGRPEQLGTVLGYGRNHMQVQVRLDMPRALPSRKRGGCLKRENEEVTFTADGRGVGARRDRRCRAAALGDGAVVEAIRLRQSIARRVRVLGYQILRDATLLNNPAFEVKEHELLGFLDRSWRLPEDRS